MGLLDPIKKVFKVGSQDSEDKIEIGEKDPHSYGTTNEKGFNEQGSDSPVEPSAIISSSSSIVLRVQNQPNEDSEEENVSFPGTKSKSQDSDKTARLMTLIGKAIETWAKEYNMERLPRDIIFTQAMDAMKAMEPLAKRK